MGDQPYLNRYDAMREIETLKPSAAKLFKVIVDQVGPLSEWPTKHLSQVVSTHLLYDNRFSLTLFLLGNGCAPDTYTDWLLLRKMCHNHSARLHVAGLIKAHKHGHHRFTTYMLASRLTAPPKPEEERKHRWDSIGDPFVNEGTTPKDRYMAQVFPIVSPPITDGEFAKKWDTAYHKLVGFNLANDTRSSVNVNIVPIGDPDNWFEPIGATE